MKRKDLIEFYKNTIKPPVDILSAVRGIDKTFELFFNSENQKWEVWKITKKGITDNEDELLWQLSAPTTGTDVSIGFVNYCKQFDVTNGGLLSADDLRTFWLKHVKNVIYNRQQRRIKSLNIVGGAYKELIDDFATQKTVVSFSTEQIKQQGLKVGFNTQKNKPIYAMKG